MMPRPSDPASDLPPAALDAIQFSRLAVRVQGAEPASESWRAGEPQPAHLPAPVLIEVEPRTPSERPRASLTAKIASFGTLTGVLVAAMLGYLRSGSVDPLSVTKIAPPATALPVPVLTGERGEVSVVAPATSSSSPGHTGRAPASASSAVVAGRVCYLNMESALHRTTEPDCSYREQPVSEETPLVPDSCEHVIGYVCSSSPFAYEAATAVATAAPAPKPASGNCGCMPSDLQCNTNCFLKSSPEEAPAKK